MKDILAKLFESQVLSEEARAQLETGIMEALQAASDQATLDAQATVAKQWALERTALIEAVEAKVTAAIEPEVAVLRETIQQFQTMKVDLGKRYIAREKELAENVRNDMTQLVNDLDSFMADTVAKHLAETKSTLKKIHEDNFGRRIYKAFVREFSEKHADMSAITNEMTQLRKKLEESVGENSALRSKLDDGARKAKVKELLTPLQGETRKVMEAVLASVPTEKLDESYKMFLTRVLKTPEKEKSEVLAEKGKAAPAAAPQTQGKSKSGIKGIEKTGDATPLPAKKTPDQINEGVDEELEASLRHLKKMAGNY
jgi:hypothetical protein